MAAVLALTAGAAFGQTFPAKPIRLIVPFAAGGSTDMTARALAQKLSEQLAHPMVAESRPGAGGNLGLEFVAKAAPDGHTLVLAGPAVAVSPSLYARLNYDPLRDFAPVSSVAALQNIMVVHNSVPANSLKAFVALARRNPGKLSFSSNGPGSTNHLATELFKSKFKLDMTHVPYKGSAPGLVALMSGEVDMGVMGVSTAIPMVQAKRLRALAVLAERRVDVLPQVPTSKEAGVDDFVVPFWVGVLAPAATPREIVQQLNGEIRKALAAPELQKRLASAGVETTGGASEAFAAFIKHEITRYARVIKDANIRVE